MAANNSIVKKSIQIDAGNTVRTVKSLKQEISDLRDELLNLEQGTQEYDDVQKQLQDDVNDLNTVMSAHKDQAEVLEGSYQDLQNQLKELKAAWKSTNDEAERDVLGQKINELNNQLKEMDASIGDFHRNVGNYESAWNGLTGVMENGEKITDDLEKGFKAFGSALGMSDKQVNALSKSLKALKDGFHIAKDMAKAREETTKAATATTQLATAQQTAAGTSATLATSQKATGAAAKTMAASETAAAGATKGLSVAMRGLKAALISTGIGALIVLLGEMIGKLDEARSKLRGARKELIDHDSDNYEIQLKDIENQERETERQIKRLEAEGTKEDKLLEERKKRLENSQKILESWRDDVNGELSGLTGDLEEHAEKVQDTMEEIGMAIGGPIFKKLFGAGTKLVLGDPKEDEEIKKKQDLLKRINEDISGYTEDIKDVENELEIYTIKQNNATGELRKWADLVKEPSFREAWSNLFKVEFEGNSPVEVLKAEMSAATALVTKFSGDTSEVEKYFEQLISEAEAEWQSLVEKEQQIFDERLTPAQRLENEKAEWIEKANRWGMDATTIVKYYDDKIQEELDRAEAERQAKREAELAEIEKQTQEQLQMMEDALSTQEKLDELFNQRGMNYGNYWFETGDTVQADIEKDMEDLQRLYDAQMQYLNGLLESADLTEEAYAGVESRILSLQVTFNNQMNELKKEADYQGKNFTILSKKGVANITLLEDAFAGFSDLAQQLGGENSEAFKGFATAQALISAFLAANRVLAEEPGGIVVKGIAAAAALATGIANVMAIWRVNPDGSNAGSSMGMSMHSATPVIGDSQPINYVSNVSNADQEDEMNRPIIVQVQDIEDGLNDRRARVENTSF